MTTTGLGRIELICWSVLCIDWDKFLIPRFITGTPPAVSLYAGIPPKWFNLDLQISSPLSHAFNWVRRSVKNGSEIWSDVFPTSNTRRLEFSVCPKVLTHVTGCPTKHNSSKTTLICCFICQLKSKILDIIIVKYPYSGISKMWSAFLVLSILPEIWRISFWFGQFCFYLTKLKSERYS